MASCNATIVNFGSDAVLTKGLSVQGVAAASRESQRDTTAFENARKEWGRATISARGKVGAGGDHQSETWLG